MTRPGRLVAVIGACGGSGASLVAGAIALHWARMGHATYLLELDLERGDLSGAWDIPADRTLADLVPVADELTKDHVRQAAHTHPSGVTILLAPGRAGGSRVWDAARLERLVDGLDGDRVVDAGPQLTDAGVAVARLGGSVLLATPPSLSGARRALGLARSLAELGSRSPRLVVNLGRGPVELGPDAVGVATGLDVAAALPRSDRDAAELSAGRWPRSRRSALAASLAQLAEGL